MRGLEIVGGLRARDIMSSPVITVKATSSVKEIAKLMSKHDIGSLIVISEDQRPIGIVTDRDIISRVLARGVATRKIKAKDIMSSPLRIIDPECDISEAADLMRRYNIRRLAVIDDKGKLVGIVSMKDIAEASQQLVRVLAEKEKMERMELTYERSALAGYCSYCNRWSSFLRELEGAFVCEECRAELAPE